MPRRGSSRAHQSLDGRAQPGARRGRAALGIAARRARAGRARHRDHRVCTPESRGALLCAERPHPNGTYADEAAMTVTGWIAIVVLWIVVACLALAVLALARQIGVLHERLQPVGALQLSHGL